MHVHGAFTRKRLKLALVLTASFMFVEAVGGWLTGSLALLSDAAHMLSDAGALTIALVASRLAERPPDPRLTMGHHRAEVLGAAVNAGALVVLGVWIAWEAIARLGAEREILAGPMMGVAAVGLAVNVGVAVSLWHAADNMNVRAALWHVFGDMLGSIGTLTAGTLILVLGWTWTDPAISLLLAVILVGGAGRVLRDAGAVLMQAAPVGLDTNELAQEVQTMPGVASVHDFHVWVLKPGREVVSLHVCLSPEVEPVAASERIRDVLRTRFPHGHITVQPERIDETCR